MNTRKYVMIAALVLFMSSITEAQNSGVTLYASGKVNVNGMGVARSTSLLDGDVVETGADGIVSMVGGGTSVMMQNNAIVQFSKQGLNVASGSVAVKTSDGMVA